MEFHRILAPNLTARKPCFGEVKKFWATAHKNLNPDSQDAEFVKQALAKLREGETPF